MSWLLSRALITACENSPSSLAPEAASSADTSSAGAPSAQLNVMPSPQPFWRNDKTMDVCSRSPFGLTWRPLTAAHGEALLTSFREGFRVPTSPAPARAPASKAQSQASGARCGELLAKFDPSTSSWKTLQCSLFEAETESLQTLPRWGMWDATGYYRLPTPSGLNAFRAMIDRHLTTCENESGSSQRMPTATGDDANNTTRASGAFQSLTREVQRAPTPRSEDSQCSGGHRGTPDTLTAFTRLPTPRATESTESTETQQARAARGTKASKNLTSVMRLPTACANEDAAGTPNGKMQRMLGNCTEIRHSDPAGGQLNPTWEDWFMGWPIGWTDVRHSATDRFRQWCDSHGEC
jgi:hypothetical protein